MEKSIEQQKKEIEALLRIHNAKVRKGNFVMQEEE